MLVCTSCTPLSGNTTLLKQFVYDALGVCQIANNFTNIQTIFLPHFFLSGLHWSFSHIDNCVIHQPSASFSSKASRLRGKFLVWDVVAVLLPELDHKTGPVCCEHGGGFTVCLGNGVDSELD